MKLYKLCLVAIACAWSAGAMAQWQWINKDGRKVFSDRPPPLEIPEKDILRQPHQRAAPVAPATAGAQAAPAAAPAPKPAASTPATGTDKRLEERKAKAEAEAEAAKAAKDKAAEQKLAADRAENCARAKQAKASLDSGQLIKHTNAKGEQVFMDDASRAAERKRAQAVIDSDCKPK
ncbi:MAG: DUF4124 domain-containing protein [Burkholderiaceae bacterium]|jgi:hypothetical protein|nr:DUF4124 domain-containing protein [Burkholderiaceae bacterium]